MTDGVSARLIALRHDLAMDGDVDAGYVERLDVIIALLDEERTAPTPTSWTCGCGHTNGINLARCATCTRKPGYDWERKEDNPCTWQ